MLHSELDDLCKFDSKQYQFGKNILNMNGFSSFQIWFQIHIQAMTRFLSYEIHIGHQQYVIMYIIELLDYNSIFVVLFRIITEYTYKYLADGRSRKSVFFHRRRRLLPLLLNTNVCRSRWSCRNSN